MTERNNRFAKDPRVSKEGPFRTIATMKGPAKKDEVHFQ